jgi:MFS family permease
MLLEITPPDARPRAVALYQTVVFASAVAGPLLGGYLAQQVGYRFVFLRSVAGRFGGIVTFMATVKPKHFPGERDPNT